MNPLVRLRASCLFLAIAACASAQNRTFTSQYSFGDSLSDSGNLYALSNRTQPPSPPYFNGRVSNGPVFTELLGNPIRAAAPLSGRGSNLNFAVAGSSAVLTGATPNLAQQIGIYRLQGLPATSTDLFTVLSGANDLIGAITSPSAAANPASVDAVGTFVAQAVAGNVQTLVSLGAKNIVVSGLPNLGATPRALASGGPSGGGALLGLRVTTAFNTELRNQLGAIAAAAPSDVNLVYVDLQGFLDRVAADPRAMGFNNATSYYLAPAAQGGGSGDPNSYVFWDDIHPTTRTHAMFAAYIVEHLNPEPVLGFAATQGTAALALHDIAARALEARTSQLAVSPRAIRRADVYTSYHFADGGRSREGWRSKFNFDAHVATAGIDLHLSDGIFIGGAVDGGRLDAKLTGNRGQFTVEDGTGRLYGVWRGGPVALILDGAYGVLRVKNIKRTTALGGLFARGKTSGEQWGGGIKALWAFDTRAINVRPWFGLRTSRVELESYTERDIPGLAMAFEEQEATSSQGAIGVDAAMNFKLAGRGARLDARAAWREEIGSSTREIAGRLANNITRTSTIGIEDGDGSGAEVGGALTWFFAKAWSASIGYTADIRVDDKVTHRGTLGLQTGF